MSDNFLWHYFSGIGFDAEDIVTNLNFEDFSGDYILSDVSGQNVRVLGDSGLLNSSSGSGFFDTCYGMVELPDDWSLTCVFERSVSGQQVIFSSFGNSIGPSGVIFGINDVDKYYLKFFDENVGYSTKTFNTPIATKNAIMLNKNNSFFSLSDFNLQESTGYIDSVLLPSSATPNSNLLTIGADSINGSFFSGYFGELLVLDEQPNNSQFSRVFTGFLEQKNEDYKSNFKMDGVFVYTPFSSTDLLSLKLISGEGLIFNETIPVDYSSGFFKTESFKSGINLYINGIYQSSGYPFEPFLTDESGNYLVDSSGNYITASIDLFGDYFYENNYINKAILADRQDFSIIDYFNNNVEYLKTSGNFLSGDSLFSGVNTQILSLNGKSLVSGLQWNMSGENTVLKTNEFSGVSGFFVSELFPEFSIKDSWVAASQFLSGKFDKKTSLVFVNGIRKKINLEYKEISKFNPLFGLSGTFDEDFEIINP